MAGVGDLLVRIRTAITRAAAAKTLPELLPPVGFANDPLLLIRRESAVGKPCAGFLGILPNPGAGNAIQRLYLKHILR